MEEDELDPRIQVELEKLNTATDEINRLEIELDEANTTFRMLLGECTRRLKVHSSKHGSAIVSARPYYEALDAARTAQQECQKAAVSFQRANEIHEAAKETVALAETRFLSQPEWRFDSAWQEMLNHATLKVREAEERRAESAAHHGATTARYKEAQDKVFRLEQRLRRNVAKSRPYFEEKARCNDQLSAQKDVVESLQRCVANVKREYANSLRRLEGISEEIHRKRANMMEAFPGIREPGVGAELEYQGELDRCDLQSQPSNPFDSQSAASSHYDSQSERSNPLDGQSECSSIRSELLEGEWLVTAAGEVKEAVEIRRAMVVNSLDLVAAKTDASTKRRQQDESPLSDLEKDFNLAQIGKKSDKTERSINTDSETGAMSDKDIPSNKEEASRDEDKPSVETFDSKEKDISSVEREVLNDLATEKGGLKDAINEGLRSKIVDSKDEGMPTNEGLPLKIVDSKDEGLPSEIVDSKDEDKSSNEDLQKIVDSKDEDKSSNEKEVLKLKDNDASSIEREDLQDNKPATEIAESKDEDVRPNVGASNAQAVAEMSEDSRATNEGNETGKTIGETDCGVSKRSDNNVVKEVGMGDCNLVGKGGVREVAGSSLEKTSQK